MSRILSWLSSVPISSYPYSQSQIKGLPQNMASTGEKVPTGQDVSSTYQIPQDPKTLVTGLGVQQHCPPGSTTDLNHHSHGRIRFRMGGSLRPSNLSWSMVSSIKEPPYQRKGTYGSVSDTEETPLSQKLSYSDSYGQPDSSPLSPKRGFSISVAEYSGSSYNQAFNQERLVPYSSSSCGSEECSSGFSFEGFTPRIGMVSRLDLFSGSPNCSPESSDRSLCFPEEPQTSTICDTLSPSRSSSHGCHDTGLEHLAKDLSVPSSQLSVESVRKTQILQREGNSDCPPVAEQSVVPYLDGTQPDKIQAQEPNSISKGKRENLL